MKKVSHTFDPESIKSIESMSDDDAKTAGKEIIQATKTKELRKQVLLRDIEQASRASEVCRILWNVYLAGEGLAVANSSWQRNYG